MTTLLAVYGALLSSAVFGWNLLRDLRDRAKFKISAEVRRIVFLNDGRSYSVDPKLEAEGASEQLFVVMSVANVGRRPMRWEGWGAVYKKPVNGKKGFGIVARGLPKILQEREAHQEYTELDEHFLSGSDNLKKIYVWDGAGSEWKLSWRQLRKLKKDAKESVTA